jgi:hypothetical protein
MYYSLPGYRGRKGEPKSIGMRDLRELLVGRTSSLGGLIVAVWGNLQMHISIRSALHDQTVLRVDGCD